MRVHELENSGWNSSVASLNILEIIVECFYYVCMENIPVSFCEND